MGFIVEQNGSTGCTLHAVIEGDDYTDFLLCVQTALKNLWLDITIDLRQKPFAMGAILPAVLKLQQVIGGHQKTLVVKGIKGKISPEFLSRLTSIGVVIADDGIPMPEPPQVDLTRSMATSPLSGVGGEPPKPPLPPASEMEPKLRHLRDTLADALKRKRRLESERQLYKERLAVLGKGQSGTQVDHAQLQKISDLEMEVIRLKNDRNLLQVDMDQSGQEIVQMESEMKERIGTAQSEFKSRKAVIDKELNELTRYQEKTRAEFKKRSETRREKLARLGSKT